MELQGFGVLSQTEIRKIHDLSVQLLANTGMVIYTHRPYLFLLPQGLKLIKDKTRCSSLKS